MFVFNVVLPKGIEVDQTVLGIVFIISFIPGIGIGILIIKYQHFLLACVLGGVGGFFLSIFVYDLILNHWDAANKLYLKIIVYIVVIAICIGIGYLTIEHLKIITSSFVGSYSLVRGPTLFLDKFPNETEMADYFTDKEKLRDLGDNQDVLVKLIIFLICWIFFSILGMYIQYKMWDKKEDEDNDNSINSKGDPALTTFLNKKL
jgi:cytochrome bd-type quinol oxidase subunit 1